LWHFGIETCGTHTQTARHFPFGILLAKKEDYILRFQHLACGPSDGSRHCSADKKKSGISFPLRKTVRLKTK